MYSRISENQYVVEHRNFFFLARLIGALRLCVPNALAATFLFARFLNGINASQNGESHRSGF